MEFRRPKLSRHVLDAGLSLIATPEKVRHPLATRSARYLVPKRGEMTRCQWPCGDSGFLGSLDS